MRFHKITYPDINNGLGCRVTLWVAGCSHHCIGCHNANTWGFKSGQVFDEEYKAELFKVLEKPYIKGITLSGGEPLDSLNDVCDLLEEIKEKHPSKDVWLFSGYTMEQIETSNKEKVLQYIDVLVDGEFHINERDISLAFRGSRNQVIWEKNKDNNFVVSELNKKK